MTNDFFTTDTTGAAHFEADRSALAAQDARDDARRDAQGDDARPDGGGEAVESTRTPVDDPWAPEIAAMAAERERQDERFSVLATPSDAHREWHRNTGIPVGLPGCPQDACDTEYLDPSEIRRLVRQRDINWAAMRGEEGDATIACGRCKGIHFAVRYVRDCDGENRLPY